jgi:hypothetical protein
VLEFVDVSKDRIDDVGFGRLMGSCGLLLAFCLVNLRVPAMWIVTVGIALNTVVIGLNEGMPTRDREVTTASGRTVEQPIERSVKHRPESDDDLLPFLGDQIVIPDPVDEVISVGDIVLAVGIVALADNSEERAGSADGTIAAASRPRLVGAATLDAIVALVLLVPPTEQIVSGSSIVHPNQDPSDAVVRAVLNATNRKLSRVR